MERRRVLRAAAMLACSALLATGPAPASDEAVDNCASLLGSLSKELRFARALAPGERTSFVCPRERETRAAVGASRERVLRALGTPDASGVDDAGATEWRYAFTSKLRDPDPAGAGYPVLGFQFGPTQQVESVSCGLGK
jgi:hypothetical protein